jgi:hypothetical protein
VAQSDAILEFYSFSSLNVTVNKAELLEPLHCEILLRLFYFLFDFLRHFYVVTDWKQRVLAVIPIFLYNLLFDFIGLVRRLIFLFIIDNGNSPGAFEDVGEFVGVGLNNFRFIEMLLLIVHRAVQILNNSIIGRIIFKCFC